MGEKKPWQSKTILANLAVIFVPMAARFFPEIKTAMCSDNNSDLILSVIGALNIALRFTTKEKIRVKNKDTITLGLLLILLSACSSVPQKLDPDKFYKRDLPFCATDIGCFEGTAVLPQRDHYEFEVAPKGDAAVDLLVLDSCHREFTKESEDKSVLDYFAKIFSKNKVGYKIQYSLIPGIEDDGDCTVRINTFEKDKGRHAWAVIRFQHPKYDLPATLFCNGEIKSERGVSLCQSKSGLTQQIKFEEKVMIETDKGCEIPKKNSNGAYEWKISQGECGYTIKSESGRIHDLLTIGFEGLLIRNN